MLLDHFEKFVATDSTLLDLNSHLSHDMDIKMEIRLSLYYYHYYLSC